MKFLKSLAGIFVGKIVLRAQLIPIGRLHGLKYLWTKIFVSQSEVDRLNRLWPDFVEKNKGYQQSNPERYLEIQREQIIRPHGVILDCVEMTDSNKNPTEYVIYGWGRSDCYEFNLERLATDALNLNKRIITFNFRGVCHSVGQVYNENDLINDYMYQVQRLLLKGVPPENIKCYGHSLCAAVATFALEELIRTHKSLKFYNDRSFANLIETSVRLYFRRASSRFRLVTTSTIIIYALTSGLLLSFGLVSLLSSALLLGLGTLTAYWPLTHKFYDNTIGNLLETIMVTTMRFGGWELKAAEAYDKIPLENKTHTVIKKPSNEASSLLGARDLKKPAEDRVILHEHSLHRNLPGYRAAKKSLKQDLAVAIETNQTQTIKELKDKLVKMSNVKITGGGHMSDPKLLVTRYKSPHTNQSISGQQLFYDFVEPDAGHMLTDPKDYKAF